MQTQLNWRPLCAPLDIVPLLHPSFFSIFGLSLFFWILWLFIFIFLIFFLHLGAQKSTHRKYVLKQGKGVAYGKFRRHAQNWQKACDHKNRILWLVFCQNKFSEPSKAENVSRVLVLVAGLFTFQVPDVSSDVNSRNMIRNKVEISTHKHSPNGTLYVLL